MNRWIGALGVLLLLGTPALAKDGVHRQKVRPHNYGTVVIDNFSSAAGMKPVTFDHWVHRAKYTCRLCHVDIGFAMGTNETEITAEDNIAGFFCGSCHDGRKRYGKARIFAACSSDPQERGRQRCGRCHGPEDDREKKARFRAFAANLPKAYFGNRIDWERAEEMGLLDLVDRLEGISGGGQDLAAQQDFALKGTVEGMPEIIFSHEKHTVWNGCEACHPDIFLGVRKGASAYSMIELFQGKYCGVCHDTVAFPQKDCTRCHTKPVE